MFGQKKEKKDWSIAIYARLKPTAYTREAVIDYKIDEVTLKNGTHRSVLDIAIPPDVDPSYVHNYSTGRISFEFDKVLDQSTSQETIFDWTTEEKVSDIFNGVNSTIFAYGQTGSGKTYTMFGGDSYEDRGLIPRTISFLFKEMKARKNFKFKCQISFLEIYKEIVYDLLDANKKNLTIEEWTPVTILENEAGIVLKNLNVFEVESEDEVINLFFMGNTNRITSATPMNEASSRSHAIFTIILEAEGVIKGNTTTTLGKINLVDLAGSERAFKMNNSKETISEAKYINLSLHYLEQVIISLRDHSAKKKKPAAGRHVPYRNNVLTSLLRDSLGGNCRSSFIVTVSVERLHFEESMSSSRFGQRCGEVLVQYHANSEISLADQIRNLYMKVREMDRDLQDLERERGILAEELELERINFSKVCLPRDLSDTELRYCKQYPNKLIEYVDKTVRAHEGPEYLQQLPEGPMKEELYGVDKAVLVELCMDLGQALQVLHYGTAKALADEEDRKQREEERRQEELRRAEELAAEKERKRLEAEERKRNELIQEMHEKRTEIIRQNSMKKSSLERVIMGEQFVKEGRGFFKSKKAKWVCADKDAMMICWRNIKDAVGKEKSAAISSFSRFEEDSKQGIVSTLVCIPVNSAEKPLRFEYCKYDALKDNKEVVDQWVHGLNGVLEDARAKSSGANAGEDDALSYTVIGEEKLPSPLRLTPRSSSV